MVVRQSLEVVGLSYLSVTKEASHLFMDQILGWTGGCIVMCVQTNLSSNFIGRCRASPVIIVPCHLIHGMLESSFCLVLHLGHSLGEVICSLYSRALGRLQAHPWVLA